MSYYVQQAKGTSNQRSLHWTFLNILRNLQGEHFWERTPKKFCELLLDRLPMPWSKPLILVCIKQVYQVLLGKTTAALLSHVGLFLSFSSTCNNFSDKPGGGGTLLTLWQIPCNATKQTQIEVKCPPPWICTVYSFLLVTVLRRKGEKGGGCWNTAADYQLSSVGKVVVDYLWFISSWPCDPAEGGDSANNAAINSMTKGGVQLIHNQISLTASCKRAPQQHL